MALCLIRGWEIWTSQTDLLASESPGTMLYFPTVMRERFLSEIMYVILVPCMTFVLINAQHMFAKYLGDPEATAKAHDEDGYFKTGDSKLHPD